MFVEVHVYCPHYKSCEIQKEQRKINANIRVCIINYNPEKMIKCKLIMNENNMAIIYKKAEL